MLVGTEVITTTAPMPFPLHPGDKLRANGRRLIVVHPIDSCHTQVRAPNWWEWFWWALDDRLQIIENSLIAWADREAKLIEEAAEDWIKRRIRRLFDGK